MPQKKYSLTHVFCKENCQYQLMKQNNPIRDKSYAFALSIVHFCMSLMRNKREYVLSKQLLKSGTSIGANIHEAIRAQSRNDFIAKMSIAHKETQETQYWITLIRDSGFASAEATRDLLISIEEIIKLLSAILKSTKLNQKKSF